MSSINDLLIKLAGTINVDDTDVYNLHFLKIINFLQKEFKIAAGSKAGSIEKGVDTEDSDLDIIFYIDNLNDSNVEEIKEDICKEMRKKYNNVECKNRSIQILLANNNHIDCVLKNKEAFEKEKKYISFVKNINDERKNAIKLLKYWKQETNYKGRVLKSWQLEKYAIYSSGYSLEAIIKNTINHFGGDPKAAIVFLRRKAEKI